MPAAAVGDVEEHEGATPASSAASAAASASSKPDVVELADRRVAGGDASRGRRRRRGRGRRSGVSPSASATSSSRQAQKSPPSARPRSERWNAWLCALTKPGKWQASATGECYGGRPRLDHGPTAPGPTSPGRTISSDGGSDRWRHPLAQLPNALTIAAVRADPGVRRARAPARTDGHSWAAAVVFGVAGYHRPGRRLPRPALARRVGVRKVRRPARRPAHDRRRDRAALARRPPAAGRRSRSSSSVTWCSSAGLASRPGAATSFDVSFLGKAATWVLYASIVCMLATTGGHATGRSWLFWIGIGMAGVAGRRSTSSRVGEDDPVKAVVMAGGEGTRLRPLTSNQPKPMVPIVGRPVHGAHRRAAASCTGSTTSS